MEGQQQNNIGVKQQLAPMDNVLSWNVRGLNGLNKQEDIKIFLHSNKIGLAALLETKVKYGNLEAVANSIFPGWNWLHNSTPTLKARILVAWRPNTYHISPITITEQMIHYTPRQLSTKTSFLITFIYAYNQEQRRQSLWSDLHAISKQCSIAWGLIGDFNTLLSKEDRIGGQEV